MRYERSAPTTREISDTTLDIRVFAAVTADGIVISDVSTHQSFVLNQNVFNELQCSDEQTHIDPFSVSDECVNAEDFPAFEIYINKLLHSGGYASEMCQVRFGCKNGLEKWMEVNSIVIGRDNKGNPIKFLTTFRDIDDHKLLAECRKTTLNLKQDKHAALKFLQETSSNSGHSVSVMQKLVEDMAEEKKGIFNDVKLELLRRQLKRLHETITSQYHFTEFESGKFNAIFQPTLISEFTRRLVETQADQIMAAGVKLKLKCDAEDQRVYICREMWTKIVSSLILIAFKNTREGVVSVKLRFNKKHTQLKIQGPGNGLSTVEIDQIFDRSFSLPLEVSRSTDGYGLNPYYIRQLVNVHAGSMKAKHIIGKGIEFVVSIPYGKSHLPSKQIHELKTFEMQQHP